MPALTWIGPISTGRSHMTYFGSTSSEKEVFVVMPMKNPIGGGPVWELSFTDASLRVPTVTRHLTRHAAMEQAEEDLRLPITEPGRRSRLHHAFFVTKARFPKFAQMSDDALFAACQDIAGGIDCVSTFDIYHQFDRQKIAA